ESGDRGYFQSRLCRFAQPEPFGRAVRFATAGWWLRPPPWLHWQTPTCCAGLVAVPEKVPVRSEFPPSGFGGGPSSRRALSRVSASSTPLPPAFPEPTGRRRPPLCSGSRIESHRHWAPRLNSISTAGQAVVLLDVRSQRPA